MHSATPAAVDVRAQLVHALELDLVGPGPGSPLESEVLLQAPSRWYLTGFLVPADADEAQRVDETAAEEVDALDQSGGTDDAGPPEPASARRVFFPSSMGLSVLVPPEASHLAVTVRWGDYRLTNAPTALAGEEGEAPDEQQGHSPRDRVTSRRWARRQRGQVVTLPLPGETKAPESQQVPSSGGLEPRALCAAVGTVGRCSRSRTCRGTVGVGVPRQPPQACRRRRPRRSVRVPGLARGGLRPSFGASPEPARTGDRGLG